MVIIFDINSHYFMVFEKPYQSKQNYNNSFNFEDKNSTTGIILKIKPMDLLFFLLKIHILAKLGIITVHLFP